MLENEVYSKINSVVLEVSILELEKEKQQKFEESLSIW